MSMNPIILDIEANGFTPDTIWCVVTEQNGHFNTFTERKEFINWLEGIDNDVEIYAHNGLAYDYPILTKLWGADWSRFKLRDSLVLSRLAQPSRSGGHGLGVWGERLGFPKGDHTDFSRFSPEMLTYCKRDVEVTGRLLKALEPELEGFSDEAIHLEHDTGRIVAAQRARGWLLHQPKCFEMLATLRDRQHVLEQAVQETFKPLCKSTRIYSPKVTHAGGWNRQGLGPFKEEPELVGGPFTGVRMEPFNLGSRKQIGAYLMRFGWKPKTTTETGQPVVDEGTLEKIEGIPEAAMISEYLMVQKRIAQVTSWLDHTEEDGRVHGNVNSNGTPTARMTHSHPNMAQVPSIRKPYGLECRSVWIVPEGYKLVGCDAEGLELRCLAHYMKDPDFTEAVVNGKKEAGTDVHTINMVAAGLTDRDQAKTFIYAFLYGAGDAKIGEIVGGGRSAGRTLKEQFLRRTPALADLRSRVERASARGWLKGVDGRKLWVRSQHSALNTLLQGAGAIVMKRALVICDEFATRNKLNYGFVGNIHDEFQVEVLETQAERFGRLAAASIAAAGEYYNFNCALAGDYSIGDNWAETH